MKMAQLLNIKAQMSSIWAKGCMLMITGVLSDLTRLPLLGRGRKSWYIIIIENLSVNNTKIFLSRNQIGGCNSNYPGKILCEMPKLIEIEVEMNNLH